MSLLLFKNDATSVLASAVTNIATSMTLSPGAGTLFPSPTAGQYFKMDVRDALTGLIHEVVHVTACSGDTLTVVRGQEGTTAVAWAAGDDVYCGPTAGTLAAMVQSDQLQNGTYTVASSASGSVNAITATLASNLTALIDGMSFEVTAFGANTGDVTLTLTLGTTAISSHAVVKGKNAALVAGDIPASGAPLELVWSAGFGAYVLLNPANLSASVTATSDPTFADNSSSSASTSWVRGAMTAIAAAAGFAFSFGTNGYVKFPSWLGGFIIQWVQQSISSGGQTISFPIAFPNSVYAISTANVAATGTVLTSISTNSLGNGSVYVYANGYSGGTVIAVSTYINLIAVGH